MKRRRIVPLLFVIGFVLIALWPKASRAVQVDPYSHTLVCPAGRGWVCIPAAITGKW